MSGNNETASTNVQAFDTFLMHLAERFPHIMEAILQDQEILDLARCLQVSKAMRRAVATVLRGKSRGSILLRRRTDKSSMRLAAKRDNGFLYLSKFGDHDHPNRKPILELDYGLLTPFAKEGPQANLCFGVDGTYLIADSHLVGIHVLRDSGEIISTVRGPWALAKTLRQDDDGHFLDSPAYSTNSMKVHFVGTNPPSKTSAEENERKKVFLVEHCWNEKEFSPVEISCSPDSWTFLTGKKMKFPSSQWEEGCSRDLPLSSGPALVVPLSHNSWAQVEAAREEKRQKFSLDHLDQVGRGGELGQRALLPDLEGRELAKVLRSTDEPEKLLCSTDRHLILSELETGRVLWRFPLNGTDDKDLTITASDIKAVFITAVFAGAVFTGANYEEEGFLGSLNYVILDTRTGDLLHRGEEKDRMGVGESLSRVLLAAQGAYLCFTVGDWTRTQTSQYYLVCARVDLDGTKPVCTCRRLSLPESPFYRGREREGEYREPFNSDGVARLFGFANGRIAVGAATLREKRGGKKPDREVIFCLDLDHALLSSNDDAFPVCPEDSVWLPIERFKRLPDSVGGRRYYNDLFADPVREECEGSHWPIYRTREDSGAMDLEGVLERPNKAAGVNALRVWRFCKAIKCEDLKEEGESPSPLS